MRKKTVSIIGIGRLGLCWALALENAGYSVLGADISAEYVDSLNIKAFKSEEPEVSERLMRSSSFRATVDIYEATYFSDTLFVFVATPSLPDGRYDHRQIDSALAHLPTVPPELRPKYVVIGCTVFPGYTEQLQERLGGLGITVVYSPQFIAQGAILKGQEYPDVVLIGSASKTAADAVVDIYKKVVKNSPTISVMPLFSAELTKLALNCFVTTKIAFANMIGDIARTKGVDPDIILATISSDYRVGSACMRYGFGYGGPCFPRDNRALTALSESMGLCAAISRATDTANNAHAAVMVTQYKAGHSGTAPVVFDYVTYKQGTYILEESQPLKVAVSLAQQGVPVVIRGSANVLTQVKAMYGNLLTYEKPGTEEGRA